MAHANTFSNYTSYGATAPVIMAVPFDRGVADNDNGNYYESRPLITTTTTTASTQSHHPQDAAPGFRDVGFAVAFWLHLVIMLYLGIAVAPAGYEQIPDFNWTVVENEIRQQPDMDGSIREEDYQQLEQIVDEVGGYLQVYPWRIFAYLVVPCLLLSFVVALLTTAAIIQPCPKTIVYSTLLGSFFGTAIVMLCAAVPSRSVVLWIATVAALLAVGYYVRLAWRVVPFAAVNLKVASQAVGSNWGVYLTSFVFAELGFMWNLYWFYVLIGLAALSDSTCTTAAEQRRVGDHDETLWMNGENADDDYNDDCSPNPLIFLALLLSLYWTSTVLLNTVQTTIAGIVATWCFVADEANQCCSPAVSTSLVRSLTYSFGSICFGSLLQAVVSVLRFVVENARTRHDEGGDQDLCGSLCYCVLECLVRCLDEVLEYFNHWAYW